MKIKSLFNEQKLITTRSLLSLDSVFNCDGLRQGYKDLFLMVILELSVDSACWQGFQFVASTEMTLLDLIEVPGDQELSS